MTRSWLAVPLLAAILAFAALNPNLAAAAAKCDPQGTDAGDIAAARAAVASSCDCATAATHAEYTRCSRAVLRTRVENGDLNPRCRSSVQRCALRSTCGRPGAVTCCITTASGKSKCRIRSDANRCKAPAGGAACVGNYQSCCDACGAGGGCVPPPRRRRRRCRARRRPVAAARARTSGPSSSSSWRTTTGRASRATPALPTSTTRCCRWPLMRSSTSTPPPSTRASRTTSGWKPARTSESSTTPSRR